MKIFSSFKLGKKKEPSKPKSKPLEYDKNKGLLLGLGVDLKTGETEEIYVEWKDLNGHTVVFGTTRVGKTRLMMSFIRQMIDLGMDLFIVDPKGSFGQEILGWVLQYAEEFGRLEDIEYISPMFPEYSLLFNPLYYLSNEEIASLVAALIQSDDDFYKNMGYEIVMAICLSLEYIEKTSPQERVRNEISNEYDKMINPGTVEDSAMNIMNPDLAARVSSPEKPEGVENSIPPLRTLITFNDLVNYSSKEGLEALYTHISNINPELHDNPTMIHNLETLKEEAIRALKKQLDKPSDYFNKVASSYDLVVSKLGGGNIGQILSTTKINPIIDMLYNKNNGNIFIIQPFPLVYKEASDAFVKIFFAMLTALYGRIGATGRGLPRQVGLCVDEGGSVLYKGVEALFNKGGGLGLRIFIFTQAFSDFDAVVGEEIARIISDNTNVKIYLRMNDELSRQRVADAFGTIKVLDDSIGGNKIQVRTQSTRSEENLLNADHVSDLPEQFFLFQHGKKKKLVKGPFVEDAKYSIQMPFLEAETIMYDFADKIKELRGEMRAKANQLD